MLVQTGQKTYFIVVDYFLHYSEVAELNITSVSTVIAALKGVFSSHSTLKTLMSDNGQQLCCISGHECKMRCLMLDTIRFLKEFGLKQKFCNSACYCCFIVGY